MAKAVCKPDIKVIVEFEDKIFELSDVVEFELSQENNLVGSGQFRVTAHGINGTWKNKTTLPEPKFEVGDIIIGNSPARYTFTDDKHICQVVGLVEFDPYDDIRVKIVGNLPDAPSFSDETVYPVHSKYFDLYKEQKYVLCDDENVKVDFNNREIKVTLPKGESGVAHCQPDDVYDQNVGFLLAYARAREAQHAAKHRKKKSGKA